MKEAKRDISLVIAILIVYMCYVICTFLSLDFWIKLTSPITDVIIAFTILTCYKRAGNIRTTSFFIALGILSYSIGDIILFVSDYVYYTTSIDEALTFVYLLPNVLYGTGVAIYFFQKLKGRELYHFLINTLTLTVIGFVLFRKMLIHLGSYQLLDESDLIRVYLYFFINLFIFIMTVHMQIMLFTKTPLNGTTALMLGIIGFILMDIPYTYMQVVGKNPENNYLNLIYALFMIFMAFGIVYHTNNKVTYTLHNYEYTEKSARKTRIIILIGIGLSIFFTIIGTLDNTDLVYLLISMFAYWITTSTFYSSALNERLLKQQDILTGLYNRSYCSTLFDISIKNAQNNNTKFAVFCIDLNSFKPVNDTYGHDMGDKVLKEFGSRMLALPLDYTSFRTGGDEFTIIKEGITDQSSIIDTAQKLQELFNTPLLIDTYTFNLSGSIGVSVYPDDATDQDTLFRYADAAMYMVKHSSNKDGYKIFDNSLVASVDKHKALEDKLRKSDPDKDFLLHYQPRFEAATDNLVEIEAFPRLKGEDNISAEELLPIAEEVGLMHRLGLWITKTALMQLRAWEDAYNLKAAIAINLSPVQLLDASFISQVKELSRRYDIAPSRIHFDISNDSVMGTSSSVKDTLTELKDCGFVLAVNKFGGGDINISHVISCGFSTIHISPALIRLSDTDEKALKLIESVIALCNNLGLSAYAVGVETPSQKEKMKEMGVKCLQGYLYGVPVDAGDFARNYIR